MIANFFNKTKPINFLVLAILVFVLYLLALIGTGSGELNFYYFLKNGIFLTPSILVIFVLSFIIRKNSMSEDNSYAILFYILFCGIFPNSFTNGGIFTSNFLLLFAFRRIYSLRSPNKPREKIFDSGFWIGIATLFYLWSFLYLLVLYAAIWIFRKADWRNVVIPLVGFAATMFLTYTYLLAFDDVERFYALWNFDYRWGLREYYSSRFLLPLLSIGFLFVISIYPTTKKSLLAKIDFKSTWQLLIAHVGVSLLIVLLAPLKNGSEFTFLFFPLSIIFANYLQNLQKYWFKEAIIYLFVVLLVLAYV